MNEQDDRDIAHLRQLANEADPVPETVYEAAKAAFTTRDLDGELAALVADSAATEATLAFEAVRTGPTQPAETRLVSFRGGGVQVELEISEQADRLCVTGQISGALAQGSVLERADARVHDLDVDDLGRFLISGVAPGAARVRCRSSAGIRVLTSWVWL